MLPSIILGSIVGFATKRRTCFQIKPSLNTWLFVLKYALAPCLFTKFNVKCQTSLAYTSLDLNFSLQEIPYPPPSHHATKLSIEDIESPQFRSKMTVDEADKQAIIRYSCNMGAFNNYVDKKGGRGGQPKVHVCPPRGRGPLNVHVDQNLAISESISHYCALLMVVKKK